MALRRALATCRWVMLFASSAWPQTQAIPYHQTDFQPAEFKSRWAAVFDKIGAQAVAVLQGVSPTSGFVFPRQTNDFYYLSGIETPQSYLLLDGRTRQVTLYLPPRNARLESEEGKVLSAEDAERVKGITGADAVQSTDPPCAKTGYRGANGETPMRSTRRSLLPKPPRKAAGKCLMRTPRGLRTIGTDRCHARLTSSVFCAPGSGAAKFAT